MSVLISFTDGENPAVNVTEENNGQARTTRFDPIEFLEKSGLSVFYALNPRFAAVAKKRTCRRREAMVVPRRCRA